MKPLATIAFLLRTIKSHVNVGLIRYSAKHKVATPIQRLESPRSCLFTTLERYRGCHFTTLEQVLGLLFGCFGLCERRNRPGYEDFAHLAAETVFSFSEVETLYELFKQLSNCAVGDGLIHKENFQLALLRNSKHENFFADRLFTLFDVKKSGVILFGEFVRSLSIFHPDTPYEEKVDFAFKLYDFRHTGFIEREEVEKMLIALFSESEMHISSELVTAILDKTFSEVDLKRDGKIDKEEWKAFASTHPSLMKFMTVPYLKVITTTSFPSFVVTS